MNCKLLSIFKTMKAHYLNRFSFTPTNLTLNMIEYCNDTQHEFNFWFGLFPSTVFSTFVLVLVIRGELYVILLYMSTSE